MGNILVLVETKDGAVKKPSLPGVTAAKKYAEIAGGDVIAAVIGDNIGSAADTVAKLGVSKVLKAEGSDLPYGASDHYASVVEQMAKAVDASAVFTAATVQGKDFFPRVAIKLGAGMVSDILDIVDAKTFKRAIYAGNIIADYKVNTDVVVATVRSTSFDHPEEGSDAAPVEDFSYTLGESKLKVLELEEIKSERPELTEAEVIISGGRGVKGEEGFKMIEELADVLNAAIGASRAAVDAGWVSNDLQVGQTGKIVAPNLYIACGISGAIQHLAGMKDSKVIVAINKDEDAPIFQVSDYGIVADFFKVWPEFVEKVKKVKEG